MSSQSTKSPKVGDVVSFWTGRGSYGTATVREVEGDRYFLDPEEDAVKGSDFRGRPVGRTWWQPRDRGVRLEQINTPIRPWYTNF